MKIKTSKKHLSKKILTTITVVAFLGGSGLLYAYFQKAGPFGTPPKTSQQSPINYNPPTEQEVASSQDAKKNLTDTPDTDSSSTSNSDKKSDSSSKKSMNVGISYADVYNDRLEIRAFTNTVIEGTGTCTATATMKGMESMQITRSGKAFVDASSTVCRPLYIPVSELHAGIWKVSVAFSSHDRDGVSETVEVRVP